MQHPSQATFARRQYGSFDGVGSTYSTSATPYSPNSSSGSPMMQTYHPMQAQDGLNMALGHVGLSTMMDQQSHSASNLTNQNSVPPQPVPLPQQQHQQHQHQQQQQLQAQMNAYLHQHHSNQNNSNQHVPIGSNNTYTQSPVEMNHPPSHMHPPPTPTSSSSRQSLSSTAHEEAVAAAAASAVQNQNAQAPPPPALHRSATHPGIGTWNAPPPSPLRMSHQGHPMSMQHHPGQMAQIQMRHSQSVPHPGYQGHYPGQQQQQQQQHPQHPQQMQPGPPPPYTMGMGMHPPLRALDAYLLARAIQNATPHNEVQQIILYAQANGKSSNGLLRAYEQNRREIDELVAQLRQEDGSMPMMGHSMSMSPVQMGMNMSPMGGMNGASQHGYPQSHIPPSIVSLQPHNHMQMQAHGHGQGSLPTSAPSSSHPPSFQRNLSTSASELDVPSSEASSPMLETPTSAILPNASKANSGMGMGTMPKMNNSANMPPPPATSSITISDPPFVHTPSKPGSRDGEPYSQSEIALIEWVIREALQVSPDIKLAQLGVLIHAKDPGRPATAWARQLSKRKVAIDRARDVVKRGGTIAEWPIEVNGRGGGSSVVVSLDGLGNPVTTEVDESDAEEGARRTRAKREEDDDAEYGERPSKRRRGS